MTSSLPVFSFILTCRTTTVLLISESFANHSLLSLPDLDVSQNACLDKKSRPGNHLPSWYCRSPFNPHGQGFQHLVHGSLLEMHEILASLFATKVLEPLLSFLM